MRARLHCNLRRRALFPTLLSKNQEFRHSQLPAKGYLTLSCPSCLMSHISMISQQKGTRGCIVFLCNLEKTNNLSEEQIFTSQLTHKQWKQIPHGKKAKRNSNSAPQRCKTQLLCVLPTKAPAVSNTIHRLVFLKEENMGTTSHPVEVPG